MPEPAAPSPEPSTAPPLPFPDRRPSPDATVPPMPSEVKAGRMLRPAASSARWAMTPLRKMARRTPRRP
jgi:hypothetical protein